MKLKISDQKHTVYIQQMHVTQPGLTTHSFYFEHDRMCACAGMSAQELDHLYEIEQMYKGNDMGLTLEEFVVKSGLGAYVS